MTEESANHMEVAVEKLQVEDDEASQDLDEVNDKETSNHTSAVDATGDNCKEGGSTSVKNEESVSGEEDAVGMETEGSVSGSKEDGDEGESKNDLSEEGDGDTKDGEDAEEKTSSDDTEGDTESSSIQGVAAAVRRKKKKVDKKKVRDDTEDADAVNDVKSNLHRSRRLERDSSDTESDAEREESSADKPSEPELSSDFEDELLSRPLPKPKWRAIPQLRARELGVRRRFTQDFCNGAMGSVHVVSRFEKYCELKHHEGCVNTLHFNQGGNLLASGSDDLEIVLWDWAKQKPVLVYESGHRSNVFQAKFMPYSGDTTLVTCARDGQVRVGELSSTGVCKETKKIVQHKQAAHKLGLEPDSPVVFLSCGEDAAVYNIDLRDSRPNKLLTCKENDKKVALYTIYVNPTNTSEFAVGGRDHYVRIYDKRKISDNIDNGLVKKYCPHHLVDSEIRANVTCCVYSYDGSEILASYNDEDIYIFDNNHSDGADSIHRYKGHRNNATVKGVNFYGPQSEFIVSGSDCGHIFLWEKESERIVQYMKGDTAGVVNCLESHPSSAIMATSGLDHDVKVWMPTGQETAKLDGLKRTMFSNRREREEERRNEPDFIDGHMLMFLMHHLRRRALRQARDAGEIDGEDLTPSESDNSDDDDNDDDDDDDLPNDERVQCAQS